MRPPGVEFAAPTWRRVVMNCGLVLAEDPGGILDSDEAGMVPVAVVGVENAVPMRDLAAHHQTAAAVGEGNAARGADRIIEPVAPRR